MALMDFSLWDNYKHALEAMTGGKNTVIFDDLNLPSVMVNIMKFNVEDIDALLGTGVHPAFIVDTVEKTHFAVGKYLAYKYGSRVYSLPFKDPAASVDFDTAKGYCTAKGPGWHLMTNWEWAAVALWCIKNNSQPRGNTDYGRHHDQVHEQGLRQDGVSPGTTASGPAARTLSGTGPASWGHDNTLAGISDITGNIWKWVDGMKLVDGKFFMPNDNNYNAAEVDWIDQGVILAEDTGLKLGDAALDTVHTIGLSSFGAWKGLGTTTNYDALPAVTRERMSQAFIDPYNTVDPVGDFWFDTDGERVPRRGGYWYNASGGGPAAVFLGRSRSYSNVNSGLFSAFIS